MARNRINSYRLVSSSLSSRHEKIKKFEKEVVIKVNNLYPFNPKIVRI